MYKTFVINLAERTDRWGRVKPELSKYCIDYNRFEAIGGGWRGCRDSHLAILDNVKKLRWKDDYHYILILEDDVEFLPDWKEYFRKSRFYLPLDWSLLYLGCSPQAPLEKFNDYLYVVKESFCTHAILYNNSRRGVVDYILSCRDEIQKIDVFYRQVIQEQFKCFVTYPLCATQWDNKSNTCKRSDVSTIEKNYKRFVCDQ